MSQNEIKKQVHLKFPKTQVWKALTESKKFGSWFGMKLEGPFVQGKEIRGSIQPTTVDSDVAEMQKPHAGKLVHLQIDRVEFENLFSFKWHPYAVDPKNSYDDEPMTLVTFSLEEQSDGTLLTIKESGFENIPLERRAEAIKSNEVGWQKQTELIAKYLALNT